MSDRITDLDWSKAPHPEVPVPFLDGLPERFDETDIEMAQSWLQHCFMCDYVAELEDPEFEPCAEEMVWEDEFSDLLERIRAVTEDAVGDLRGWTFVKAGTPAPDFDDCEVVTTLHIEDTPYLAAML